MAGGYKKRVLVIGSGVAGLLAALKFSDNIEVIILTKESFAEGSTYWAQGGIAAVLDKSDSYQNHFEDTLAAGGHLNDKEAVNTLVKEGSKRIKELIDTGFPVDRSVDGDLSLTLEGAHSVSRIIHAGGDRTGRILHEFLGSKVKEKANIRIKEHSQAFDFHLVENRIYCKVLNTKDDFVGVIEGDYLLIATGGCGQVYKYTTNPPVSTGDGLYLANKLGLTIQDLEFYQFHPTALRVPKNKELFSQDFLISESVRGEGGILKNSFGEKFVEKYDVRGDLAPRDVVARAIWQEMRVTGEDKVFLDISTQKEVINLPERFPGIYKKCLEYGIDLTKEPIPISPSAHYQIGGIVTDLNGRTSLDLVYAAGEAACTGVHGANRLASNSLLEGLVFSFRVAEDINRRAKNPEGIVETSNTQISKKFTENSDYSSLTTQESEAVEASVRKIKELMWQNVGLIRTKQGLRKNLAELEKIETANQGLLQTINRETLTLRNLLKTAQLITGSALGRKESVGAHYLKG